MELAGAAGAPGSDCVNAQAYKTDAFNPKIGSYHGSSTDASHRAHACPCIDAYQLMFPSLVYMPISCTVLAMCAESPCCPPLQLIIGGLGKIDLSDWKTNTRLKHCTSESNVVRWFWLAVEAFSEERRGRLLQFVTGSTRVPLQGFKALQGGSWTGSYCIHLLC